MNEALAPPHIVTVGRHRIARVLQRVAEGFDSQARLTHLSTSFDNAVDAVLALHARKPIDALALARARALAPSQTKVALVTFGAPPEQVA